jgi:hypothetical protein
MAYGPAFLHLVLVKLGMSMHVHINMDLSAVQE